MQAGVPSMMLNLVRIHRVTSSQYAEDKQYSQTTAITTLWYYFLHFIVLVQPRNFYRATRSYRLVQLTAVSVCLSQVGVLPTTLLTRRVAVYLETHCTIGSNRAYPTSVLDR